MNKSGVNVRSIDWDDIEDDALTGAGDVLRKKKFWQTSWFLALFFGLTFVLTASLIVLSVRIQSTQKAVLHLEHFSDEMAFLENVDQSTQLALILKEKVGIQRNEPSVRGADRTLAAAVGTAWTDVRREALVPSLDEGLIRRAKQSTDHAIKAFNSRLKQLKVAVYSVGSALFISLFACFILSLSALRRGSTTLVVQRLERGFHDRKEPIGGVDRKKSAAILRNMPVALVEFESDGRILRWNSAMEELTGLTADLAMRRGLIEGIGWSNAKEMARSTIRRLFTGEDVNGLEWSYKNAKGTELELSASFAVVHDGGGSIRSAVGIIRDVTQEKTRQELFVANDMAKSAILKSLPDSILRFNANSELVEIHDNGDFLCEIRSKCGGLGWKTELTQELVGLIQDGIKQTRVSQKPYIFEYRGLIGSRGVALEVRVTVSGQSDALAVITDLSDRERALQAEQKSQLRFQELINGSADAIVLLNEQGRIDYASPAIAFMLGVNENSIIGKELLELTAENDKEVVEAALFNLLTQPGTTSRFVIQLLAADGVSHSVEVNARNLIHKEAVNAIVFNLRDITERRRLESELQHKLIELESRNEQLRQVAMQDSLTGTLNHKAVLEYLGAICEYAATGGTFSVAFVDVDNFKEFNMEAGFEEGDELLISLANVIQTTCREEDICGRLGSEEFLVILPEANASDSVVIAERIQQQFAQQHGHGMSLSIGIITVSNESSDATTLLNELSMQMAKAHDRGPGTVYHPMAA
ncbi:MAG: PAS domain S-box protein [Fimbriimonadaceae bacterium]|nr:MAG: PAS domain S-box protein [Fimbriimonadaceae bacterium]